MTSLTDRYIWAAVRTVPEAQRSGLEPEIREMIEESIDVRLAAGDDPASAERATLTGLGDPERLAADYVDRPLVLVGPRYYLEWLRLLKTIAFISVPIAAAAVFVVQLFTTGSVGGAIGSAAATAISVTVHVGFWTTLLFVILERTGSTEAGMEWTVDRLPELPDGSRDGRRSELVASLVFLAVFAGLILWQQMRPAVRAEDGSGIPLLDPALWTSWLPWFLGLIVAEAFFATWIFRRGWSWSSAAVNLVLGVAFTVPALQLWAAGDLLNPAFLDATGWEPGVATEGWTVSTIVTASVLVLAVWDVADGFLKAGRASGAASPRRVLADH